MILLTRLDHSRILINLEAVKFVEAVPDSLLSFVNGDSVIVRESLEEIQQRVVEYKTTILKNARAAPPPA